MRGSSNPGKQLLAEHGVEDHRHDEEREPAPRPGEEGCATVGAEELAEISGGVRSQVQCVGPTDDLPHIGWHATSTTGAKAAIRASPLRRRPCEAASMGLACMGAVTVGSPQAMPASRPLPDNPNRKAPLRFRTAILLLARTVDQPRHPSENSLTA
jgi:hypothetical protein